MTREMVIESGHRIRLFSFTVLTTMQKKNTRRSSGDGARAGSDRELRELLDLQFKGRLAATCALQVTYLFKMGKCKFAGSWLEHEQYKPWLKPVSGNDREAYCSFCKKKISVTSMGINALRSHMLGASHKSAAARRQQVSIEYWATPSSVTVVTPPTTIATAEAGNVTASVANVLPVAAASTCKDLRVTLGATPTLRTEVLWCLDTAAKHHSLSSNEGISGIFQEMFPDSDIAKTFTCGKDKTGYITKFGLAPYFKQQLVDGVNKAGQFVLMFDESLNHSTKTKQLDVHVRYWEDDRVQSRYLGSQFLGHGRAHDLLHHIKVSVSPSILCIDN